MGNRILAAVAQQMQSLFPVSALGGCRLIVILHIVSKEKKTKEQAKKFFKLIDRELGECVRICYPSFYLPISGYLRWCHRLLYQCTDNMIIFVFCVVSPKERSTFPNCSEHVRFPVFFPPCMPLFYSVPAFLLSFLVRAAIACWYWLIGLIIQHRSLWKIRRVLCFHRRWHPEAVGSGRRAANKLTCLSLPLLDAFCFFCNSLFPFLLIKRKLLASSRKRTDPFKITESCNPPSGPHHF